MQSTEQSIEVKSYEIQYNLNCLCYYTYFVTRNTADRPIYTLSEWFSSITTNLSVRVSGPTLKAKELDTANVQRSVT